MVTPERIIAAAIEHNVDIIGLSNWINAFIRWNGLFGQRIRHKQNIKKIPTAIRCNYIIARTIAEIAPQYRQRQHHVNDV
jgi:5-methyltetrahydrofolate--homocysteine methyltransferase